MIMKKTLFCIAGETCSGKDTLVSELIKKNPDVLKAVCSYTTRPKRDNETEGKEHYLHFDPGSYTHAVFGMYGGEQVDVTLRIADELAGIIIDRFGTDITFFLRDDGFFDIHLRVAISPNFLSWVIGFGGKIKIVSPLHVVGALKALATETLLTYRE